MVAYAAGNGQTVGQIQDKLDKELGSLGIKERIPYSLVWGKNPLRTVLPAHYMPQRGEVVHFGDPNRS